MFYNILFNETGIVIYYDTAFYLISKCVFCWAGSPEAGGAGRVVVRAADGRGCGAAGAPRAAAPVAGGLPPAHRGRARPPGALSQSRQVLLISSPLTN